MVRTGWRRSAEALKPSRPGRLMRAWSPHSAGPGSSRARRVRFKADGRSVTAAAIRCASADFRFLDRGAGNVAVRAEDAAVAGKRFQQRSAMAAVVEILARVARHRFDRALAALRT